MEKLLDILASGIHDAKNQLFIAEGLLARAEPSPGSELGEARYLLEAAARRLDRTLTTYRLMRHDAPLALIPTVIDDLCAEIALGQSAHLRQSGIELRLDGAVPEAWVLDRELVEDMLNNAVQNAARHARTTVRLGAAIIDDWLTLSVEDDGPGFASLPPRLGTGLLVATQLAALHRQGRRQGELILDNASPLGGARFLLRLP